MIERIIDYSVRHKLVVILLVCLASILGAWSITHARLDALPELGDTQVIIYSRWDRSPELVEEQVTYPIVTALQGAPHVKTISAAFRISDIPMSTSSSMTIPILTGHVRARSSTSRDHQPAS